jgi:hypothetical protein
VASAVAEQVPERNHDKLRDEISLRGGVAESIRYLYCLTRELTFLAMR